MRPLVCCLLLLCAAGASAQARRDTVRGRVLSDSGKALPDADVIITMAPTRVVVSTRSDSSGAYRLAIAEGTGEYLLYVAVPGRIPARRRLTAMGGDSTFVVNVTLSPTPATAVAGVRTTASASRPPRSNSIEAGGRGVSGTDRNPEGVPGQLPPDLATNVEALGSTIPGLSSGQDGLSAFGMSGANLTTLNGLGVGVSELPRDAKMTVRFQTSPFDPTNGGFAGAQMGVTFGSGTQISYRRSNLSLDAASLQAAPAWGRPLGQTTNSITTGFGADGPIRAGKYFYNMAAQFRRAATPVASLSDLDGRGLQQAGVARDSAARLLDILSSASIPTSGPGQPDARTTTAGSFIIRFDRPSTLDAVRQRQTASWWSLGTASFRELGASGLAPSLVPASTSVQRDYSAAWQGFYSTYTGPGRLWLNESMAAASLASTTARPFVTLPSGRVLVASEMEDGSSSVRYLSFGGAGTHRQDHTSSFELVNATTLLAGGKTARPVKLYLQGRYDGFDQLGAGSLGVFTYSSLDDLAANRPSSFSRRISGGAANGGELAGAAAVSANWTIGKVNLVGGVRADANRYTASPSRNEAVASQFGVETDHVPNTIGISPRLGFTWTYRGFALPPFGGSQVGSSYRSPTVVRGGIGRFRSRLAPSLISPALMTNVATLSCVGSSTPIPNWGAYSADTTQIPESCADSDPIFADASPGAVAFARSYGPQDAWRATLGTARTFWNRTHLSVDGAYSLNFGQTSSFDRNFSGAVRSTLPAEGERPLFVDATDITASGEVAAGGSRAVSSFGTVIERRSDLRSRSGQVVVRTIPNVNWGDPYLSVDYVWSDVRAQRRGFDATAAGDPREAYWAREAYTPTHRVILQTGKIVKGFALTAFTSIQSGVHYTPTVSRDINGDGLPNDRAFVFGSGATDSAAQAAAAGIQQLVDNGSKGARSCLARQRNAIAAASSCVGPWTTTMNARIAYFQRLPRFGRRAAFSLNLANPLAGADLLLHGSNGFRGWGSAAAPDPTLLFVRGYDVNRRSFAYEVNPRFGTGVRQSSALLNPFRVTLDVRMDIGRSVEQQQIDVNLRAPLGSGASRANADTIRRRFLSGTGVNAPQDVYGHLLYHRDSLALSRDQISRLEAARRPFRASIDSMYTELAAYLVELPGRYDGAAAAQHIRDVNDAAWKLIHAQGTPIREIITPAQLQLLASPIVATLTRPFSRSYWSGAFGARW